MSIMTSFKAGFLNRSHTLFVIGWINGKSRPKLPEYLRQYCCVILLVVFSAAFFFFLKITMCQKSHTLVGTTVDEEQTLQLRKKCAM